MEPTDMGGITRMLPGNNSIAQDAAKQAGIRVKELSERDRRRLLMHFLALGPEDRMLRFGAVASDETITRYVQMLDFSRDAVFGVYDDNLRLLGAGHLAFLPRDALPVMRQATAKPRVAEFGISVASGARGHGIGSRLFERAAIHCRNEDVDTLYIQCLTSNQVMMHIAWKAGMEIHSQHGESDAYLKLKPADPASMMQEAVEEQFASFDYTLKANTRLARNWWRRLPGVRRT
jgi:GNAT superfamily N-acetyltransferase